MSDKQFRAALKRLGLSRTDAAERLGVTRRAVQHWVAGTRHVPEPVVILLKTWLKDGRV